MFSVTESGEILKHLFRLCVSCSLRMPHLNEALSLSGFLRDEQSRGGSGHGELLRAALSGSVRKAHHLLPVQEAAGHRGNGITHADTVQPLLNTPQIPPVFDPQKDQRSSDMSMDRPVREVKGHGSQVVFFSNLPREEEKKKELLTIAGRFGIVEKHLFLTDQVNWETLIISCFLIPKLWILLIFFFIYKVYWSSSCHCFCNVQCFSSSSRISTLL